jgi:hypothetical protein
MLILLINGMRVNLPADMQEDFYASNPFFTKKGEWTLDIDIDLHDPQNAIVYKSINRLDVRTHPTNRTAVLFNADRLILHGTEVIDSIDENKAKIQLVGGNSELNYLGGTSRHIQDVDMGIMNLGNTEQEMLDKAVASWGGSYPEWEWVCLPVCSKNETTHKDLNVIDNFTLDDDETYYGANIPRIHFSGGQDFDSAILDLGNVGDHQHICALPYVPAFIERLISGLGFKLGSDAIATDERYKHMIFCSSNTGVAWNCKVPNVLVNDFITDVEAFFNVIFDINEYTRVINIYSIPDFYAQQQTVYIPLRDVIGNIKKDYKDTANNGDDSDDSDNDGNDSLNFGSDNLKYNLSDDIANKYDDVSKGLIAACDIIDVTEGSWSNPFSRYNYADIWKIITGSSTIDADNTDGSGISYKVSVMSLFRQTMFDEQNLYMLRCVIPKSDSEKYGIAAVRPINQFAAREIPDPNANTLSFNIIPCKILSSPVYKADDNHHGFQFPFLNPSWPPQGDNNVVFGNPNTFSYADNQLNKYVQDGYKPDEIEDNNGRIEVAFYDGLQKVTWEDPAMNANHDNLKVPVATTLNETFLLREKITDISDKLIAGCRAVNFGYPERTMSILGTHGMYAYTYSKNPKIDKTETYTIQFKSEKQLDPRSIFVIGNMKFYCKQLKYSLTNHGMSQIIEGTFYKMTGNELSGSTFTVTIILGTDVTTDNALTEIEEGSAFTAKFVKGVHDTPNVSVKMGDEYITAGAWYPESFTVYISNVTGNIEITAE